MLVLSRKIGEKLVFPSLGVTVQVVRIEGGKVRLGIEAPPEVRVHREELQQKETRPEFELVESVR
jgi:carbon storage regulator